MKWIRRRSKHTAYSGPTRPFWRPTHRKNITTTVVLPEKQRVRDPFWAPQPGDSVPENESLEHLALKTSGAYIWESRRDTGARDPS